MKKMTVTNENLTKTHHPIFFNLTDLPIVWYADYLRTEYPILHVERTTDHDVLLFILSGCMPVIEDDVEYFLRAGDIFFLKHGIHHYGQTPFEPGTSWMYIHFEIPNVDDSVTELAGGYSHTIHVNCHKEDYEHRITLPKHLHQMQNTDIERKFRKVVELFTSRSPLLTAYVNSSLHQLLVDIYMYNQSEQKPNSNLTRVNRLIQYLNQHLNEPFDSGALQEYMQLSYKYLEKIFIENTGISLHECHTRMKIERACKLLGESDRPITIISDSLGFSDPLYFSNVFKKYMGVSPRTWRKKN